MIVCSCRVISTTDYKNFDELIDRIMSEDAECGSCQAEIEALLDDVEAFNHNPGNKK